MASAQTILNTLRPDEYIGVEIPGVGLRVIAELYSHSQGLVFLDVGWCDPLCSGHAAHLLQGTLEGKGPWSIGGARIRILERGEDAHMTAMEWRDAVAAESRRQGEPVGSREQGKRYARAEFGN